MYNQYLGKDGLMYHNFTSQLVSLKVAIIEINNIIFPIENLLVTTWSGSDSIYKIEFQTSNQWLLNNIFQLRNEALIFNFKILFPEIRQCINIEQCFVKDIVENRKIFLTSTSDYTIENLNN